MLDHTRESGARSGRAGPICYARAVLRGSIRYAIGAVAIGGLYTIAPLAACVAAVAVVALPRLLRGLVGDERRWVIAIVAAAIAARLFAIGATFVRNVPLHDDQFVGAEAGDEAYAMSRALRTRDIVRESPTATKYDYFVAFDEYGRNSYVTALTALEIVFGPTPYSLRLLNVLLFLIGALLLYRVCRTAFGGLPAAVGLVAVLFWPTLFVWSISLLKEPLYFLLSAVIVTAAIHALTSTRWATRAGAAVAALAAAVLIRNLRPGALPLAAAGIAVAVAVYLMSRSARLLAFGAACAVAVVAIVFVRPRAQDLLIGRLEAAAKTHTGHVFTVGHDYKLLDAGFYFNPSTPAASTLTLKGDEAARYVVRALVSFVVVPAPWQLRSARELAFLPEQVAWYVLAAILPLGIAAGWGRNPLVTAMLVGYAVPTAAALALTNGNVGTLLRLRGLVLPELVWVGALGFCAMLGTAGEPRGRRAIVDDRGRLFGRVNLFDAAVAAFVVVLLPIAYGTYLLFRTPTPRLESVASVPITREERRVAGGSLLTAKLKVRGEGLRPMLRATIDDTPALGFVFESPHSADVLVGSVPPGRHDFVLFDGVQEVARLPKAVEIRPLTAPRVSALGTVVQMERAVAESLSEGAVYPQRPEDKIVKLGPPRQDRDGLWQRRVEVLLRCDPDPDDQGCAVGGFPLRGPTLPTIRIAGPAGASLLFVPTEVLPDAPAVAATVKVRFASAPEVVRAVRAGDRDECLDDRAAVVASVDRGRGAADVDATLRLGVDRSPDGWTYRGRLLKIGARIPFTTDTYVLDATLLSQPAPAGSESRAVR